MQDVGAVGVAGQSPTPLAGGPFRAENGLGCPLTSLLLDPCEVVGQSGAGSCVMGRSVLLRARGSERTESPAPANWVEVG
jgi:hypothetical protein